MGYKSTPEHPFHRFAIYFITFHATLSLFKPFTVNVSVIQKPEPNLLICSANQLFIFRVVGTLFVSRMQTVFTPNTEKYRSEKTPCLDTFHSVKNFWNSGVKKVLKENKAYQIFWKTNISYPPPWYVCVSGSKRYLCFRKFCGLCFFVTPILRVAFLPHYRRVTEYKAKHWIKG